MLCALSALSFPGARLGTSLRCVLRFFACRRPMLPTPEMRRGQQLLWRSRAHLVFCAADRAGCDHQCGYPKSVMSAGSSPKEEGYSAWLCCRIVASPGTACMSQGNPSGARPRTAGQMDEIRSYGPREKRRHGAGHVNGQEGAVHNDPVWHAVVQAWIVAGRVGATRTIPVAVWAGGGAPSTTAGRPKLWGACACRLAYECR